MTDIHESQTFFKSILKSMGRCVACAAYVAVFLSGCGEDQQSEQQAPLRQVRSMVVETGTGVYERSYSGTLHASQETSLSFKVSGTIQNIAVKVGDRIKKGDVIASLDSATYALQAQQSQAALVEAQSSQRNAKASYDRTKKLYESGNVSRSELDDARAASDSAAAAVQSASKVLEIARLNLSYTRLKTDEDCAIASVDAEEGENVAQGSQVFFAACGEDLEVKLDIPESIIASIKKGMNVDVIFSALEGKTFKGRVNEVGVTSVQGGTTFPVTVLMTDQDKEGLKPGLSADVVFSITGDKKGGSTAIVVPTFAIGEDQTGRFAFILQKSEDGRTIVKRQPVKVGRVLPNGIEVQEGLTPGMRVITAGVSVLRDGMEVKYTDE